MSMTSSYREIKVFPDIVGGFVDTNMGHDITYAIHNTTATAITAGTIPFQDAAPLASNNCLPDPATWAAIPNNGTCLNVSPATPNVQRDFTATSPLPASGDCYVGILCHRRFVRAFPALTGTAVSAVVLDLK